MTYTMKYIIITCKIKVGHMRMMFYFKGALQKHVFALEWDIRSQLLFGAGPVDVHK